MIRTDKLKTDIRAALSRCSALVMAVVIFHALCWLSGSSLSPVRGQLGRIHDRLVTMTTWLWVLLAPALVLSFVYERSRRTRGAAEKTERNEREAAQARQTAEARAGLFERCRELIAEHAETLARKRGELVQVDDYGVGDDTKWEAEKAYFQDKVLFAGTDWEADLAPVRRGLRGTRLSPDDLAEIDAMLEAAVDAATTAESA